eukprot:gb/GECG01000303.1/.p1 GENE.gb/GECG01000303.1/~~gb/GECG01000303.1/.p1  ORF type:complete len:1451 (+),score=245.74 gb/GECG01000303.1/:1-4353(+)
MSDRSLGLSDKRPPPLSTVRNGLSNGPANRKGENDRYARNGLARHASKESTTSTTGVSVEGKKETSNEQDHRAWHSGTPSVGSEHDASAAECFLLGEIHDLDDFPKPDGKPMAGSHHAGKRSAWRYAYENSERHGEKRAQLDDSSTVDIPAVHDDDGESTGGNNEERSETAAILTDQLTQRVSLSNDEAERERLRGVAATADRKVHQRTREDIRRAISDSERLNARSGTNGATDKDNAVNNLSLNSMNLLELQTPQMPRSVAEVDSVDGLTADELRQHGLGEAIYDDFSDESPFPADRPSRVFTSPSDAINRNIENEYDVGSSDDDSGSADLNSEQQRLLEMTMQGMNGRNFSEGTNESESVQTNNEAWDGAERSKDLHSTIGQVSETKTLANVPSSFRHIDPARDTTEQDGTAVNQSLSSGSQATTHQALARPESVTITLDPQTREKLDELMQDVRELKSFMTSHSRDETATTASKASSYYAGTPSKSNTEVEESTANLKELNIDVDSHDNQTRSSAADTRQVSSVSPPRAKPDTNRRKHISGSRRYLAQTAASRARAENSNSKREPQNKKSQSNKGRQQQQGGRTRPSGTDAQQSKNKERYASYSNQSSRNHSGPINHNRNDESHPSLLPSERNSPNATGSAAEQIPIFAGNQLPIEKQPLPDLASIARCLQQLRQRSIDEVRTHGSSRPNELSKLLVEIKSLLSVATEAAENCKAETDNISSVEQEIQNQLQKLNDSIQSFIHSGSPNREGSPQTTNFSPSHFRQPQRLQLSRDLEAASIPSDDGIFAVTGTKKVLEFETFSGEKAHPSKKGTLENGNGEALASPKEYPSPMHRISGNTVSSSNGVPAPGLSGLQVSSKQVASYISPETVRTDAGEAASLEKISPVSRVTVHPHSTTSDTQSHVSDLPKYNNVRRRVRPSSFKEPIIASPESKDEDEDHQDELYPQDSSKLDILPTSSTGVATVSICSDTTMHRLKDTDYRSVVPPATATVVPSVDRKETECNDTQPASTATSSVAVTSTANPPQTNGGEVNADSFDSDSESESDEPVPMVVRQPCPMSDHGCEFTSSDIGSMVYVADTYMSKKGWWLVALEDGTKCYCPWYVFTNPGGTESDALEALEKAKQTDGRSGGDGSSPWYVFTNPDGTESDAIGALEEAKHTDSRSSRDSSSSSSSPPPPPPKSVGSAPDESYFAHVGRPLVTVPASLPNGGNGEAYTNPGHPKAHPTVVAPPPPPRKGASDDFQGGNSQRSTVQPLNSERDVRYRLQPSEPRSSNFRKPDDGLYQGVTPPVGRAGLPTVQGNRNDAEEAETTIAEKGAGERKTVDETHRETEGSSDGSYPGSEESLCNENEEPLLASFKTRGMPPRQSIPPSPPKADQHPMGKKMKWNPAEGSLVIRRDKRRGRLGTPASSGDQYTEPQESSPVVPKAPATLRHPNGNISRIASRERLR